MAQIHQVRVLRSTVNGADKVWAGMLLQAADSTWALVTCWGKRGTNYQFKCDTLPEATAKKQIEKKGTEKVGEGYVDVFAPDPDPVREALHSALRKAVPGILAAQFQDTHPIDRVDLGDIGTISPLPAIAPNIDGNTAKGPIPSHVQPLPSDDLPHILADAKHGVSEKVNGTRCLLTSDGQVLRSFNRRGVVELLIPDAASKLEALLPAAFEFDGERLEVNDAGSYLLFDILSWEGQSLRNLSYLDRITHLEHILIEKGLIRSGGATAEQAFNASLTPGFGVLVAAQAPAEKQHVFDTIMRNGGEGIIVRTLSGPSVAGDTSFERKHKFVADLDVIAYATNKSDTGPGSLSMGLLRPADHALIDVGKVSSGFNKAEVSSLGALIAKGQYPVLQVTFLPVRTVGIKLVEPRAQLRTDKSALDCTTDQLVQALGPSRSQATADLIANARAVSDVQLLTSAETRPSMSQLAPVAQTRHRTRLSPKTDHEKDIRAALAAAFPRVPFTVRHCKNSSDNSIQVNWTDGPTVAEVEDAVAPCTSCATSLPIHDTGDSTQKRSGRSNRETLAFPHVLLDRTYSLEFLQGCANNIASKYKVRPPVVSTFNKRARIYLGEQRVEFGPNGATIADKIYALAQTTSHCQIATEESLAQTESQSRQDTNTKILDSNDSHN